MVLSQGTNAIDAEKSDWVRWIYQMRADGLSLGQIATELDANGVSTNRGKVFSRQAVLNILNNHFYEGTVRYGGLVVEGHHIPIIFTIWS